MKNSIQIKNVTKKFKHITALNNINLNFEFGKIYGLLGKNGAGKSTLINIISNRKFADEGEVLINELPAKDNMLTQELLYCVTNDNLYENFKIKNLFYQTNEFYNCFDIDMAFDLAKKFQLNLNTNFENLSTGYKSIVKLIIALSLDTPYIIYDEPVLGLDANHRDLFYSLLLKNYEMKEKTIIIATHLIEEIANIIEEIIIIDKGNIILQQSNEQLMNNSYSISGPAIDIDEYCHNKNVIGYDELGNLKTAYILGEIPTNNLNANLTISKMNLQKLFIKLTNNNQGDVTTNE